ncbi:ATP-binding cassette domain-containing protein [Glycomyces sp. TRM65418]|uniref:ABC-F family ATP-binding cassette domain-containing protein n=1 Tax=Glycomyces sp. TRM65418 TaxID=2867006 RepID=UPI001CE6CB13|nr:ATP-binding cassette domain-containing protein [Glycomyces sp. TRM65418]MCC3764011.1 ATP-binding cassette domain-containing protein [Glycomyces sp. TRM65418]QZD53704.1 ATP-binding cassette domain-containing protein [Glycomyces sp. TRM65418]
MGFVDLSGVRYGLSDGTTLFDDVSFRVGEGAKVALIGANGAGKTTLLDIVTGALAPDAGTVAHSGGLGVMRQLVGMREGHRPLWRLALSLAAPELRVAGERFIAAERLMGEDDSTGTQLDYAQALADWGELGGYEFDVLCDTVSVAVLGLPWEDARDRPLRTLSGGEQKRFALRLLLRGRDEVLALDEPDNFLDVPAKRELEQAIRDSDKSILFVSHDREVLANAAESIVTLEAGTTWTHGGGFATWHEARAARHDRFEELRRRWDEEHQKLRELMLMYKNKAAYNADMASRYRAAQTRLRKFEEAGPPPAPPREQDIRVKLEGGRTGKRAVVCEQLELEDLTFPFDLEVWYGDRVAVLGANGTGKSHFLRLLARGGSDPGAGLAAKRRLDPVRHSGVARLGARVSPGHFSQTHEHPEFAGRTLREILWEGDEDRPSLDRSRAMSALNRYELTAQSEQDFKTLSGGQQARFMVLLLELSGATCLLLDEPTDNLDLASAEALEQGLRAFDGTVIAVTHDRWFTRGFDRFVVFRRDGEVVETDEPVWDVR